MKKTGLAFLALSLWLGSHSAIGFVKPKSTPILRIEGDLHHLRQAPNGRHLAFTDRSGKNLRLLDLVSGEVFEVTKQTVGPSLFWAPDAVRLFYREMYRSDLGIESRLMVYDLKLHKNVELDRFHGLSGYLSFDPRDLRFFLMKEDGILSRTIVYPDERLAKWQRAKRKQDGRWLVTPQRVLWLNHGGLSMRDLKDDQSGIQSFDISPDGRMIAWSTIEGKIYYSEEGGEARAIAKGYDPRWHPQKPLIAYSSPKKIGFHKTHTDLKISDIYGRTRDLTRSADRNERWPTWTVNGQSIYYTIENSTDLFVLDFEP